MENEEIVSMPTVAESATVHVEAPVETVSAPIEAPAPVDTPAPVVEHEVAPEPEAPSHAPSLLSEFEAQKPEEVKPVEVGDKLAAEEAKQEPVSEEHKPVEPITYEEFKIPEGSNLDKKKIEDFTKAIGEHRLPQETAQKLVDMHIAEMKDVHQKISASQWDVYNQTRKEWRDQVMSDPEIGGAGHQTAMKIIAEARDHIVPASERKEFNDMLNVTGVGDNPVFLKAMYRAGKILQAPQTLNVQIQPTPDRGEKPKTKYSELYTHPTSKM